MSPQISQILSLINLYISAFVGTTLIIFGGIKLSNLFKSKLLKWDMNNQRSAYLLGGVSIFIASAITFIFFSKPLNIIHYLLNDQFSIYCFMTLIISFLVGILDDMYELRVLTKLVAQIVTYIPIAIGASLFLFPFQELVTFLFVMVLSITLINSLNLMDGIDTNVTRMTFYSFALTFLPAVILNKQTLLSFSCVFIASLNAFYYFNRNHQIKVYLGETGVGIISVVLLSISLNNTSLLYQESNNLNFSVLVCLTPLVISCSESLISFLRRALAGQSPFSKDALHIHQIYSKKYNISDEVSGLILTLENFLINSFIIMLGVVSNISVLVLWALGLTMQFVFQFFSCKNYWFPDGVNLNDIKSLLFKGKVQNEQRSDDPFDASNIIFMDKDIKELKNKINKEVNDKRDAS